MVGARCPSRHDHDALKPVNHDPSHTESALVGERGENDAPIFIAGIMPRSGTNFLHRLLCQHPDCGAINTTPVREDYLLHHAASLKRYLERLKWQWGHWGADDAFVAPLYEHAGRGLTGFLRTLSDAPRIVTKTPSVSNIESFPDIFPHAYLLIIVRDGRSVVASGMSGFGWNFETASRAWARAARAILAFRDANPAAFASRCRLVQYERLNTDTKEELAAILRFVGLDPAVYDFDAALDTPVYGSSYQKTEGKGVSWQPKAKAPGFASNERWATWSRARHERFNWIAGRELIALGYEAVHDCPPPHRLGHRLHDASYLARRAPRNVRNALRAGVRAFVDALQGNERGKVDLKR